jgi:ceramide glucosyltransferase
MMGVSSLPALFVCGLVLAAASASYLLLAIWRVLRFHAHGVAPLRTRPAVTVLKPICGAEPRLYECLRSFCALNYAPLQIVFGVGDPADPAVAIVERLIEEFPTRDLALVIDRDVHGTNLKVSNLINMYRAAKHDVIVVSDSDTEVRADCFDALVAPLEDRGVGAVTCLYKGKPTAGIASALGALFINDWFLASAVVDAGMREVAYCFGPVTALRRDALEAIGGFGVLSWHLADDFMLGRLIAEAGYKVRLARYVADIVVAETGSSLLQHELRWARTVRAVKPGEHVMSVAMELLPLLLLLLLPYPKLGGWAILGVVIGLRVVLHYLVHRRFNIAARPAPWLLPLRECLCFAIWLASFRSTSVNWRQREFVIVSGGRLEPRALPSAAASGGS